MAFLRLDSFLLIPTVTRLEPNSGRNCVVTTLLRLGRSPEWGYLSADVYQLIYRRRSFAAWLCFLFFPRLYGSGTSVILSKQASRYYVTNDLLVIMDPGRENSSNLLLDSAKFKSVDTISINERHPQELIKCILEHEASGTPLVLTGLDSCTSWPSVIPQLLRRDCFTTEGWNLTRPLQEQYLTS